MIAWKRPLLRKHSENFRRSSPGDRPEFDAFCQRHSSWLDDYALFMAIKDAHDLVSWTEWEPRAGSARQAAVGRAREQLRDDIECNKFIQFEFERQWCDLKAHCTRNEIRIHRRHADLRGERQRRRVGQPRIVLAPRGRRPRVVAGVPPDYFSATGQLWGNPLYNWEAPRQDRLRLVDRALPPGARDAGHHPPRPLPRLRGLLRNSGRRSHGGERRLGEGPGRAAVCGRANALGDLPIVAEDLGVITPEVEASAQPVRLPGHGHPAIRLRQRSRRRPTSAAQLSSSPRRLHRHARQRHRHRLVEQQGRRGQRPHRSRCGERKGVRQAISQHRRRTTSTW